MRLFFESIMIFLCTLLAAAVIAFGEPGAADLEIVKAAVSASPFSAGSGETSSGARPVGWTARSAAPSVR